MPSDIFLFTAMGIAGVSLVLKFMDDHGNSSFIGQWVAPILILGVYNKLVKQEKINKFSWWAQIICQIGITGIMNTVIFQSSCSDQRNGRRVCNRLLFSSTEKIYLKFKSRN